VSNTELRARDEYHGEHSARISTATERIDIALENRDRVDLLVRHTASGGSTFQTRDDGRGGRPIATLSSGFYDADTSADLLVVDTNGFSTCTVGSSSANRARGLAIYSGEQSTARWWPI
jgi:hypothetical protein